MAQKNKPDNPQPSRTLRGRAEQMLRTSRTDISGMPTEDIQSLLHELQVHQMELEIQNEDLRQAQIELADSRDRYSDLYEFAPVGYLTLDRKGQILQANLGAADMLGIVRHQLLGTNFAEVVDREGQDAWHLHRQAAFSASENEKQTCELPLWVPPGKSRWVRLESCVRPESSAFAEHGDLTNRCRTALIDISDRKGAEAQLHELNATLEQQVSQRTDMLKLLQDVTRAANEAHSVDTAMEAALQRVSQYGGWQVGHVWRLADDGSGEMVSSDIWYVRENAAQAIGPLDRFQQLCAETRFSAGQGMIGQVLATGEPQWVDDIAEDDAWQCGSPQQLGLHAAIAFPVTVNGQVVTVLEFFSDQPADRDPRFPEIMPDVGIQLGHVVARMQSEESLRKSEERRRAILDAAPDAIISIDGQGVMTHVNPATEQMFGYSADEMLGQNVSLLMPSPYREEHDRYVARYLESRQPRIIGVGRELVSQHKDGRVFPIRLNVSEIDHTGLFVGIVQDISAQKALEKQVVDAAADEQRRIGQDIHDGVGQELTGLRYMAQTHAETLADQCSPDAKTAKRMTQWLETVQQQMRAIIRELIPVEVDQRGLVAALRGLAERTTATQSVVCSFDCHQSITVSDAALATHLYRIAQEAVRNAMRHGQAQRINIRLGKEEGTLWLEVIDDGVGISDTPDMTSGIGLRSMAYRASLIGAKFGFRRNEEGGTRVTCAVLPGMGPPMTDVRTPVTIDDPGPQSPH